MPEGKNRCVYMYYRLWQDKQRKVFGVSRWGFKHLRRKITKIVSHCRAWKSQSIGIALQDFHRTVEAQGLKPRSARNFCKQACPSLSYDWHVSIMFDWSSHSRAPFAGKRRFSKPRRLSTSISFLPLPFFHILALAPTSHRQNTAVPVPFLGL